MYQGLSLSYTRIAPIIYIWLTPDHGPNTPNLTSEYPCFGAKMDGFEAKMTPK